MPDESRPTPVPPASFGVFTDSTLWRGDRGEVAETAAELDDLGYQVLWLGGTAGNLLRAEALLDATRRMTVATGIINIWTDPATEVAASYRRVDARHPHRLLLGLGVSHAQVVDARGPAGVGPRYRRPVQRMGEYLDDLDGRVPYDRIVLAALGPRMLALAAARTAGAHPYLVSPAHTAAAREVLGPGPLLAPEHKVVLETDPATARATARPLLAFYLRLPNYVNNLVRMGFDEDDVRGGGSDRLVDALVAWGDVDTVGARLRQHLDAGADHVTVQLLGAPGDRPPLAGWRRLAEVLRDRR